MRAEMVSTGKMGKEGRFADLARTDKSDHGEISEHFREVGFEDAVVVFHGFIIA